MDDDMKGRGQIRRRRRTTAKGRHIGGGNGDNSNHEKYPPPRSSEAAAASFDLDWVITFGFRGQEDVLTEVGYNEIVFDVFVWGYLLILLRSFYS